MRQILKCRLITGVDSHCACRDGLSSRCTRNDVTTNEHNSKDTTQNGLRVTVQQHRRQGGFTLVELLIVITIMVILYALAAPSLRNLAPSSRLKSTARGIRSLLTYARDTAMTEGAPYLVVFDLDNQQYWLASSENFDIDDPTTSLATEESFYTNSQQSASASEEEEEGTNDEEVVGLSRTVMILGIPREPSAGIEISSMNIAHNTGTNDLESEPEEVSEGIEYIYFTPAGASEDMVLYVQDKRGKTMSVRVKKETGWVSIQKESQSEVD